MRRSPIPISAVHFFLRIVGATWIGFSGILARALSFSHSLSVYMCACKEMNVFVGCIGYDNLY